MEWFKLHQLFIYLFCASVSHWVDCPSLFILKKKKSRKCVKSLETDGNHDLRTGTSVSMPVLGELKCLLFLHFKASCTQASEKIVAEKLHFILATDIHLHSYEHIMHVYAHACIFSAQTLLSEHPFGGFYSFL